MLINPNEADYLAAQLGKVERGDRPHPATARSLERRKLATFRPFPVLTELGRDCLAEARALVSDRGK